MNYEDLIADLKRYQRLMIITKTAGDHQAHENYRQITRWITEQIREHEKTACSQQTAS
ncbi:hypothetical protein J5TS2_36330 [Brevibacillus halotolerans]|uniref:hypothetical protein n=1 Tax=Brevibacillus halotolerans TaxID=1507437 RepID=UPI001B2E0563|nr:hypothetical protein [Brevibacillus halotolerans]GIO02965.1 hypothetical protein J5TS2_36330 [Brevibacillus halotolerans]